MSAELRGKRNFQSPLSSDFDRFALPRGQIRMENVVGVDHFDKFLP